MNYLKITGTIPTSGEVTFTLKVLFPHYLPQGVKALSRIDSETMVASCSIDRLKVISEDKSVVAIVIAKNQ